MSIQKNLSRRNFLKLAGSAAAATVLVACGGQPTATPAAEVQATQAPQAAQPVKLQVLWNNWGENYNNLMKTIGDDYTKANPNVTVEWTFLQDFLTKLLTQVAGGTPPDFDYTNFNVQAALAEKKTFIALDDYVKAAGLQPADWVKGMYDACLWDGDLFALPGGVDWICLVWSKDVYKAVGLDPEKPPATYAELLDHSAKILQKDADGNLSRIGFGGGIDPYWRMVYMKGGRFWDPDAKKVTANEPINVDMMTSFYEYIKTLDVNKLAAFNQRPGAYEAGNTFGSKQSAYLIDGFWVYDALNKYSPDIDYGVTLMPSINGTADENKNFMVGGWMLGIPTGSKNKDEAWKFMKYAFIDQAAKMGYLTLNGPTVIKTYADFITGMTKILGEKDKMSKYLNVFTKVGEAATKYWPVMRANAFYTDEETRIYDFIMRGEKTAQEGLDEVTKNVQAEYDKGA